MVSVVTIVKNDKENIEQTMLSVLQQTYENMEYIIKDALSSDGTSEMVDKIIEKYPEKKIHHINVSDQGIYDAMNQAVSHCNGEWIIFMNSGDLFYNLDVLKNIFENEIDYDGHGVLYGDAVVRDKSGDAIWEANIDLIKKKMPFCHQSCFIRKELLIQFPFNIRYKIAADYNNILDLYLASVKFMDLKATIGIFNLEGISSTKYVARYKEKNLVIRQHELYKGNIGSYLIGLLIEYIKTVMDIIVPSSLSGFMRKWYKRRIKHYKMIE